MQINQINTLTNNKTMYSKQVAVSQLTPTQNFPEGQDTYTPSFGADPKFFDFKSKFFLLFLGSAFGSLIYPPAGILGAAIFGTAWLAHTAGVILKGGAEFGEQKINHFFQKKLPEVFAIGTGAGKKLATAEVKKA